MENMEELEDHKSLEGAESMTYLPALSPAGIRTFMRPSFTRTSSVVAHLPGASGAAPSSYLPFSKILTKEFSVGGLGER